MGAIADAMHRFAQPLIDATDGSPEQLQRALSISQLCWNLAMSPESEREAFLATMQPILKMDDKEFHEFKWSIIQPMIQRHQEMFPALRHEALAYGHASPPLARQRPAKKYAGTGRNERCPCGSGKKYKVCCGR